MRMGTIYIRLAIESDSTLADIVKVLQKSAYNLKGHILEPHDAYDIFDDHRQKLGSINITGVQGGIRSPDGPAALAEKLGVSRQRAWQMQHHALGLCSFCNEPLETAWCCKRHAELARGYQRKRRGGRRWKPGGPGRPPKDNNGTVDNSSK